MGDFPAAAIIGERSILRLPSSNLHPHLPELTHFNAFTTTKVV